MKTKSKSKSSAPKIDPYIDGLMAKLLERLVSLENKVDRVLSQTAGASSGNGHPPKPFQNTQVQPQQQQPRRDRVLYEAICADCSKVCEVPFKPSEDRAVYCKTCFARRKSGGRGPGMPVLTPVAMSSSQSSPAQAVSKKPKKSQPAKKTKKKK